MNYYEWKIACKNGTANHHWDGACRRIQRSLLYNADPNAFYRHHLRDTEEQRQYNDTHYELWGFNEDGTFEYGKYIIFVTPEEHTKIHLVSDETRRKQSINNARYWLGKKRSVETVQKIKDSWTKDRREKARQDNLGKNNPMYGKVASEETRQKMSKSTKLSYDNNPELRERISISAKRLWKNEQYRNNIINKLHIYYSIPEHREAMSKAVKAGYTEEVRQRFRDRYAGEGNPFYGKRHTDETKKKIGDANRGENSGMYGKHHTDESRRLMSKAVTARISVISQMYKEYKANGGTMTWNEYQKYLATQTN